MTRGFPLVGLLVGLLLFASPALAQTNVMSNPGAELLDSQGRVADWTPNWWAGVNAQETYCDATRCDSAGHSGAHSLKIEITGGTPGSASWLPSPVTTGITGGKYYTYSDWYRSNRASYVTIGFVDSAGVQHWVSIFAAVPASADWKQFVGGFTMPTGATNVQFYHAIDGVGWLQTDDFDLEENPDPGFAEGMVSLTFDDGSQGFYDDARPVLRTNGFKSTQYIPTWGLMTTPHDSFLMTDAEIRQLAADGDEIGAHSITHPSLALCNGGSSGLDCIASNQLDPNNPARRLGAYPDPTQDVPTASTTPKYPTNMDQELTQPKAFLQNLLGAGSVVDDFAYPFGEYNGTVIQHTQAAGYKMARSVDVGYNARDFQPYAIKVQNMTSTTTQTEVQSWIDFAKANKLWLVIVYHEVFKPGSPDAVCPDNPLTPQRDLCFWTLSTSFTNQMAYLKSSGLSVKTMKDAFNVASTNDRPPVAGTVSIAPTSPAATDTLTATPSGFTDPDAGDTLTYSYTWSVNGQATDTTTAAFAPAGRMKAGDVVAVDVQAKDSHGLTSNVVRASVTVAGTPPPPNAPALSVTPATGLSFTATVGGATPAAKTLTVANTVAGTTMAWTATDDVSWLNVSASGTNSGTISVAPNISGLAAGTYTGNVTVTATGATGSPQTIPVTLTVTAGADRTRPTVSITSPTAIRYTVGQVVNAAYTCADNVGVTSCVGTVANGAPVSTTRGNHTFSVTARDAAGNTTTQTVRYSAR